MFSGYSPAWLVVCAMAVFASPALAQDFRSDPRGGSLSIEPEQLTPLLEPSPRLLLRVPDTGMLAPRRPAALVPLYVTLAGLQVVDLAQTLRGVSDGARELNPAAGPFASNRAALAVLKSSATVGSVFFTERLWKKNRAAAIAVAAVVNSTMAAIVARNASVLGR